MSTTQSSSPPGGTGASSGLGETFSINLSSGTAMHTYQLPLPDGVAKHTPRLALEYAHGTGLGAFGLGWRLELRAISAGLDLGTPADGPAERLLDSGTEIVPTGDGTYRALRETAFSRYTRVGDGWRIEERNGTVHELGTTAATRVAEPGHPDRVVQWLLARTTDPSGNAIDYAYRHDGGYAYPESVRYAAYEVRLEHEQRPDVRHDGRAGFSRHRALRCSRIRLVLDPGAGERLLRTWDLGYELAPGSGVSLLTSATVTAHGTAADGSLDVRRPTVRFAYTPFLPTQFVPTLMRSTAGAPPPLSDAEVALVTLDDAPLPGVLVNRDGRQVYWRNAGDGRWAAPQALRRAPLASTFDRAGLAFVDMDGSGTADLLVTATDEAPGYFENAGRDGWGSFVAFPADAGTTPDWANPALRLLDADADGLVDAIAGTRAGVVWWRNRGRQGWSAPTLAPADLDGVDLASPDVHLADMTGDGAPDLVRVRSGRVEYWPSLGRGRFGPRVVMADSPRLSRGTPESATVLLDLDGDGCADLAVVTRTGVSLHQNRNGQGFAPPVVLTGAPPPLPGTVRAVNLSGAATAGLVWNTPSTGGTDRYVQWGYAPAEPPHLLARVDNGAGLVSALSYRSAVDDRRRDRDAGVAWSTNFPFPYVVVASMTEEDLVSGRRTEVRYRYREAHFESRTRQFQGFRSTERVVVGDDSRADTREVHHFLMAQERLPGNGPGHAALNGLLSRVETYADDGSAQQDRPYRVEECDHDLTELDRLPDGRSRVFVFVTAHRVTDTERGDDARVEEKRYTYDGLGNVVREEHRGSGTRGGAAVPVRVEVREVEHAVSATRYLVDKPARTTLRDGAGTLLSEQRFCYDGPDFVGLPLGQVDRGLVTRERELVLGRAEFDLHYAGLDAAALGYDVDTDADGGAAVFSTPRRARHDTRGLAVATMDPLGVVSTTTFDADGLFRTGLSDPFGLATFTYDRATGQIVRSEHADGAVTRFAHDAQGRVLRSALPGQDLDDPATVYSYDESVVPHRRTARMRQADGSVAENVTYFDGGGQELQQRVTVTPGTFLVSGHRRLNPWGDVAEEHEPTFAADLAFAVPAPGASSRRFRYDGLGRVTECVNYNGGRSTVTYEPFRVVTRDANDTDDSAENVARGQFDTPHVEEMDAFRDLVRVSEQIDPGTGSATAETTELEVGPLGELLGVADEAGVKLAYRYDRRGCRLGVDSREAGRRRIFYDARKNPVRTLDGDDHDLRATWDDAGRLTTLTGDGQPLETYTYDTADRHALGRLARVEYVGGAQDFAYDAAGHLLRRSYHFDGEPVPQTLDYSYDPLGRPTAVVHTDGRRLERQLTANGWLAAVPGVVERVDHDPRGLPRTIAYANGVRTELTYTPGPGRLSHQVTTSAAGVVLADVRHGYDLTETLLSSDDVAPGGAGRRDYSYDPLYQLTRERVTGAGGPVDRGYAYVGHRNLARLDEAASTLHYDDAAHRDRLSGVTVDGQARFDVAHDAGGNLLGLPGLGFTYNVKNELVRLETDAGLTAEYAYDHLGLRTTKRVDDGRGTVRLTHYVGDQAELRDGVASHFVTVGGLRCAVLTGDAIVFVHDDPSGSSAFFTDATGERVGQVDRAPFGGEASRSGSVDFETYTLHPVDPESGLVYMRRRYYCPAIGRFLTPDLMALYQPEHFVHAPASLHLYAYVANDPMNKVDEDGLSFWSVVGSVVGVVVGVVVAVLIVAAVVATGGAAGILLGIGLVLLASLAVTGISYVVASNVNPGSGFGQFMRGFMIGFNAGMNAVIATAVFGPVVGVGLGVINFLATFEGVSQSPVYQGILGWSSWLMPMSWGATGLGLVFYAVNLVAAGVTGNSGSAKIEKLAVDWKTGTIVMNGGLIQGPTAFDMGNFVFMNPGYVDGSSPDRTYDAVLRHETGHTLAVAAFGTAFGIADLIGENVVGAGANDYGEKIAESHANRAGRPTIPMWG